MAKVLFWGSFLFIAYVYFGYPLLLLLWRWVARRPVRKDFWEPSVSIVIAARNEKENIASKICNCLKMDYPANKLEIIVSLDGPSDGTEQIARQYEYAGVRVIHYPEHQGKAAAVNRGAAAAGGDVIVFADARQRIHPRAIRELAANLSDNSVGAVSGEMVLLDSGCQDTEDAHHQVEDSHHPAGLYWRYDKWLRAMESDIDSSMGTSGALYAIRRELFHPMPGNVILDDVFTPMQIVLMGKRVVFEPLARVYDTIVAPEAEFSRKVRTLAGNYQLLSLMPELLIPWRHRAFLQFSSHKVGRLLVPFFLTLLFLSNLFLLQGFYLMPFALQLAWYLLALTGRLVRGKQQSQFLTEPLVFGRS